MADLRDDDRMPPDVLASWADPEPLPGFADRVARRIAASPEAPAVVATPRRRAPAVVAFVAGLAAGLVLALVWSGGSLEKLRGETTDGDRDRSATMVSARTSYEIGSRAMAVAEPGARLGWHADARGIRVEQSAGEVFYRVEDAAEVFEVVTPHGTIVVEGTCFTVDVVATGVEARVHEGEVSIETASGSIRVGAGERWTGGEAASVPAAAAPHPECPPPPECPSTPCECGDEDDEDWPGYPISEDVLREYVDDCRVVWDSPPFDDSEVATGLFLATLGLDRDETPGARRAPERSHAELRATVEAEYTAATGERADDIAFEFLVSGLAATASELEQANARRRIAEARAAGEIIAPLAQATPLEQAYRAMVGFGDAFERNLAEELGSERAHELRARLGGWNGDRQIDEGCP